jgi:hypothetical protein
MPPDMQGAGSKHGLTRRADYMCPSCGGRFYGPTECRGTMTDGFHNPPVKTLPIVGCEPPPLRSFRLVLGGFGARAVNADKARALLEDALRWRLGGDTKKAREMFDRISLYLDVEERPTP